MNLIIEKSIITLLSLMVCFSVGMPLLMSGLVFLQGSEETLETEAMITQINQIVQYLETNPSDIITTEIYIPANCILQEKGAALQIEYTADGTQKTRTIYSSMPILIDGINERGRLNLVARVVMQSILIELAPSNL